MRIRTGLYTMMRRNAQHDSAVTASAADAVLSVQAPASANSGRPDTCASPEYAEARWGAGQAQEALHSPGHAPYPVAVQVPEPLGG